MTQQTQNNEVNRNTIIQHRQKLKLSQRAFGKRYGYSDAAVSTWESGKATVPMRVVKYIRAEQQQDKNKATETTEVTEQTMPKAMPLHMLRSTELSLAVKSYLALTENEKIFFKSLLSK